MVGAADDDWPEYIPGPTLEERKEKEFRNAFKDIEVQRIEPTEEEKRNGWDAESLTAYVHDQTAAQSLRADPHSLQRRVRPTRQNSKYSPLRWRR